MHFTHCSYLRAGSLGAWRHAHLLWQKRVADFVARSHPEFSQKLAKLRVRHVRAMKFSVYRRCAGGTVDSLKHLRLGPPGGRRVYFRIAVGLRTADLAACADVVVQSLRAALVRADALLNVALLELAG